MVGPSPSQKRKDRKGRENDNNQTSSTKDKTGLKRPSKSFTPLASKKFYLDIKNNTALTKLEAKLKSLGASIEQFLVKEVNYVVTDRKDSAINSPDNKASCSTPVLSTSPSPSPSFGVSSPLNGIGQKKTKSRAEAMLERVRLQPQTVTVDPLDNARSWNIPIYSLQEIFLRLEKLCAKQGSSSKPPGLKILKSNYIKLETGRRPEFKQLREWPTINLNTSLGESPFTTGQDGIQRMTRKAKDGSERLAGGYCEMCCVDFPDIKAHVLTQQHIKIANNADYYAQVDNIINTKTVHAFLASQMCAGRCLRRGSGEMGARSTSLAPTNNGKLPRTRAAARSLDDKPLEVQFNGIGQHSHLTRSAVKSDGVLSLGVECIGEIRRTRTISASLPASNHEPSQLSPTGSDITHHLRSRKQMWLPTSLLGTTAEDALNNVRLRPSRDYSSEGKGALKSPVADESSEKKIKTVSADDEEIINNVDCSNGERGRASGDVVGDQDKSEVKERLVGKFSESSKVKVKVEEKKPIKKQRKVRKDDKGAKELANLSYDCRRRRVQKKRLSVEEKLIEDNKTYYKVEVLNSKLRSTGYYISQSQRELEMSKANGNDGCVTQNCAEPIKSEVKADEKEPVVVRFKKVRQTELSLLSDEAENFMFGEPSKRESSVSTESSEEDDASSLKMGSEENEKILITVKKEVIDESSIGSCSITSSSTSSRRKRKSPDESVIQDNADYYKFETTGSRLRFHGNLFPPTPGTDVRKKPGVSITNLANDVKSDCKNVNILKVKLDESYFEPESRIDEEKPLCKYKYDDLEFSFESAPTHEAWYQTFKRQDECQEYYYPSYTNYPTVLLPYEYPYSVIKRLKGVSINENGKKRKSKHTKVHQLIVDDKPRKSPRCHASTLAIMSSLKRRRPRDSPEKRSELPPSELSLAPSEVSVLDEESRCSTIIDPPSIAPSDTQFSTIQTPTITIPEIKIGTENKPDQQKVEAEITKAEEDIDTLLTSVCLETDDDVLAHLVQSIKKEVEYSSNKESNCQKKGKNKGKSASAKQDSHIELSETFTCLPVDPAILDDEPSEHVITPGPIVDVMSLIDGYRGCSSMERADYEHMNPHAVDALRALIAESCNSSDCGGSSACDYSFLEDGRSSKKRKKKRRNMTGWPANHKKKCIRKCEELSTVVLRRNCKIKDGIVHDLEPIKETQSVRISDDPSISEVKAKKEPSDFPESNETLCSNDNDTKTDSVISDSKVCSTISRTNSIDSSSIKSYDVQSCYIKVRKMSDDSVDTMARTLRSSDPSPSKSSTSRRGTPRQAKIVGRKSLRRCR